jgi:hypothetical protein
LNRGFALLLFVCSCGYHAVYADSSAARLHVRLVRSLIPDSIASDEVLSGMREELARLGALEAGEGFPRAEVEVLLADEASEGIAAVHGEPAARATEVSLAARAWIVRAQGEAPESDTGDVRAEDVIAVDESAGVPDLRATAFHESDALRAAGHRLGQALARKLAHSVGAAL